MKNIYLSVLKTRFMIKYIDPLLKSHGWDRQLKEEVLCHYKISIPEHSFFQLFDISDSTHEGTSV